MDFGFGEYSKKEDYHIDLDSWWPYLSVYLKKIAWVRNYFNKINKSRKILRNFE